MQEPNFEQKKKKKNRLNQTNNESNKALQSLSPVLSRDSWLIYVLVSFKMPLYERYLQISDIIWPGLLYIVVIFIHEPTVGCFI